ncbi:hypothetical protein KFE98_09195 [bacterium SCSIO 12741]|nr:hypothetical protein KFE98_09195 [bacterium SCSIO 12741]
MNFIFKSLQKGQLLLLVAFLFFAFGANASHVSGGSIKYKYVGPGATTGTYQYYIEVAVFRDCAGINYSATTANVTGQCSTGGASSTYTLNHLAFVAPVPSPFGGPYSGVTSGTGTNQLVAEEVSDLCDKILNPGIAPTSNCRNGTAQGYLRFKYSGIITLTQCNYWVLGFTPQCCRNTGNSNISSGGMYVETRFDNLNFFDNSAPDFADEVKPIPSACVGKKVLFGIGTIDNDGDSLKFTLNCAMQNSTTCANYTGNFSATAPAANFTLDPKTGLMEFTPASAGKRVVAFWVTEYERCTGTWKAQTLRDVQFRVATCNNNIPIDSSGISNVQGKSAIRLSKYKLQVCNGTTFSFEDTIYDKDIGDTLAFNSNHDQVMPGSQMTVTSITSNKAVVKFTWTASIGNNPIKIFYLVFNDDKCDYPGNGFSVFEIQVRNATSAGPDMAVCMGADTVTVVASGGSSYQWASVYGDSLQWGVNIWGIRTPRIRIKPYDSSPRKRPTWRCGQT